MKSKAVELHNDFAKQAQETSFHHKNKPLSTLLTASQGKWRKCVIGNATSEHIDSVYSSPSILRIALQPVFSKQHQANVQTQTHTFVNTHQRLKVSSDFLKKLLFCRTPAETAATQGYTYLLLDL